MITSKAIPICRSLFQGQSLMSSMSNSEWGARARDSGDDGVLRRREKFGEGSAHDSWRRACCEQTRDQGNHCTTNFQQINFAYETLLNKATLQFGEFEDDLSDNLEGFAGVGDDSWEDWEEWMGWEGAGIRDCSDHINYAF